MDSKQKRLIFAVVSCMFVSMMTLVVQSRKGKRRAVICYGPIDERDRMRSEYLNNKIWRDETTCVNMLRLGRGPLFRFCKLFRDFSGTVSYLKIRFICPLNKLLCFSTPLDTMLGIE